MLKIEKPITLTPGVIKSPNVCADFDSADLKRLGDSCREGYLRDKMSRLRWEQRNEAGMDLALQVQKAKSFPWAGASNVAFPLVTIAALQFHARAYPALVNGKDLVQMRVTGDASSGMQTQRAERISTDMSWQLLEEDKGWEPGQDTNLLNLAIVGTTFKKSYRAAAKNTSELVLAKDLVLDYWAKSVESCPRKTHVIPLSRNDVRERIYDGVFKDVLAEAWFQGLPTNQVSLQQSKVDQRQGVTPPMPDETTPFMFGEQHVVLDLDGDGYAEPWTITFEVTSGCVVRIVARFDEQDVKKVESGTYRGKIRSITAEENFTKYTFIPSPDGGIYDIGFGVFLGPLNESVNSIINQLIDCGTMQVTAGGFLGRGAKIRGGVYTFAPFQWNRVDSTGDDLRKNIVPLEVREPSMVLFQLLSLLINYTNRVSGSTDMMVGENPGQNTPAETSRTMVEMGTKIYTAIFKRIWRCEKNEFEKLFILNRKFGRLMGPIGPGKSTREDYLAASEEGICPAADPNITSDVMAIQLADKVLAASQTMPGFNRDEAVRRWLKANKVDAIEAVYPGTEGQEPPIPEKVQLQMLKNQQDDKRLAAEQQEFVMTLMQEREVNQAMIAKLFAEAQAAMANAESESAYAEVARINAIISTKQEEGKSLDRKIDVLLRSAELRLKTREIEQKPKKEAA